MKIIIVGAGVAGVATALALDKWMPNKHQINIIEIKSCPSTIGGAIGLTPNAVRALATLGAMRYIEQKQLGATIDRIELFDIYSATNLGNITFTSADGQGLGQPPFKGLRILRSDLMEALVHAAEQHSNISIEYGCVIDDITESDSAISIGFANGQSSSSADLLVGADGIHSIVRRLHIEPDRMPEYTGIAAVGGFTAIGPDTNGLPWKDTALSQALRGSLLCSHFEDSRTQHFIAAVMETPDVESKEGWIAMGKEHDDIKRRVEERYLGQNVKMAAISELVKASHSWNLYPIYSLSSSGKWSSSRAILVGDAAHAMPPQGESAGIAFEDAIVLARVMAEGDTDDLAGRFAAYERLRRPRTDEAYRQATFGWNTLKDSGWLAFQVRSWITWVFLWWTAKSRAARYSEDLSTKVMDIS